MIYKLSIPQFHCLMSVIPINLKSEIELLNEKGQFIIVSIKDHKIEEIRDFISEDLQKEGFDINFELTSIGTVLEELIDIFYEK